MKWVPTQETLYERWDQDKEISLYDDEWEDRDDEQFFEAPVPQKEFSD